MPEYWYSYRAIDPNAPNAELNRKIVAEYKPYFMTYVYPSLRTKYRKYVNNNNEDILRKFHSFRVSNIEELENISEKTPEMEEFIKHYHSDKKIGMNPCIVNRICWLFEDAFPKLSLPTKCNNFDYSILKSDAEYTSADYDRIYRIYQKYLYEFEAYSQSAIKSDFRNDSAQQKYEDFAARLKMACVKECPNEDALCNIIVDICYRSEKSKRFAWTVVGDTIIKNLLRKNGMKITFPVHSGDEFEYSGELFEMKTVELQEEELIW